MDNSLRIKEKLDDISKYVPGTASDIAAMLDVHVNTLRNIKADGYNISVATWTKINDLHKKAMKIKKVVGADNE